MTPREIARLTAELRKAAAGNLRASERVADLWSGGSKPTTADFGPPQSSSGMGAARMIGDYSNTAPQHGATRTAESLSDDLLDLQIAARELRRATADLPAAIARAIRAKARESAEDDDDDDDLRRVKAAKEKLKKAAKAGNTVEAVKHIDSLLGGLNVINSDVRTMMTDLMTMARSGGRPIGSASVQKSHGSVPDAGGIMVLDRATGQMRNSNDMTPKLRRVAAKSGAIFESVAKSVAMLTEPTDRERGATILRMIESGRIDDHHICVAAEAANGRVRDALAPLFA